MPLETTKSQLLQAIPKGVQFVYSKDDPAMIARINSDSADLDRDKQFPILSISKSFCGAVSALMAADRKFGKEGVDATVSQALEAAIINNPAQAQQIREYLTKLESKGLGDITLAELLTHKSGIDENFSNWRSYRDNSQTQTLQEITSREFSLGKDRGEFRYSNSGYTLLEEIINLASEKGGYEQELQHMNKNCSKEFLTSLG
jgi:CubicO group peptidase (beta-lactamase class C family)